MIAPLRAAVRRSRFRILSAITLLRLLFGPERELDLWVGDSHAMCLNEPRSPARLTRAPHGQYVAYLGPRLMYTIARDDFPSWVRRLLAFRTRLHPGGRVRLLFCTGEIDLRCHLVPRAETDPDVLAFVEEYVARCRDLARAAAAASWALVTPPPPSATVPDQTEFPVKGTIGQRIHLRDLMVHRLRVVAEGESSATVIDIGPVLSDSVGALSRFLTDDDCHTNASGVTRVRHLIAQELPEG